MRGTTQPSAAERMLGRFGWGFADQLLSSVTNFLLSLFVARTVGPQELGAFSVAYATFTFSLGAVRAIAADLLAIRHSTGSDDHWLDGVKGAAGTAAVTGLAVGAACLIAGASVGGSFGMVLSLVGLSLPFLLVQDVWRFALLARGRGGDAFLNDVTWAATMFASFALVRRFDVSSIMWFTAAWAGAGCVAAAVGVWQLKVVPHGPAKAVRWLRSHRDLAPRYLAEFAIGNGVSNLTFFTIGAIAGLAELGGLRAGEIALSPLNVLFGGVGLVATAEGVRLLRGSSARLARGCRWLSLVLAVAVLAGGTVVLLVPHALGESLMGANWSTGRPLLAPLLLSQIGFASSFGASIGLRALAAARRSLRAKCIEGALTFVLGVGGAYLAGATGVAWGYALGGILRSLNAWWQFSRALHEYNRPGDELDAGAATPTAR